MTTTTEIFSARAAELEDARAESQETVERQLVTAETAAEDRLIDLLAVDQALTEPFLDCFKYVTASRDFQRQLRVLPPLLD